MTVNASRAGGLEILFIVLGVAGLVATWAQVPAYLSGDFVNAQLAFWKDAVTTPASVFLAVDITVLAAAVLTWMFAECRRLRIAPVWAWGYLLGSLFVAICCFVPLFFAHRQRRLRRSAPDQVAQLAGSDFIAVALVLATAAAAGVYSLTHLPA